MPYFKIDNEPGSLNALALRALRALGLVGPYEKQPTDPEEITPIDPIGDILGLVPPGKIPAIAVKSTPFMLSTLLRKPTWPVLNKAFTPVRPVRHEETLLALESLLGERQRLPSIGSFALDPSNITLRPIEGRHTLGGIFYLKPGEVIEPKFLDSFKNTLSLPSMPQNAMGALLLAPFESFKHVSSSLNVPVGDIIRPTIAHEIGHINTWRRSEQQQADFLKAVSEAMRGKSWPFPTSIFWGLPDNPQDTLGLGRKDTSEALAELFAVGYLPDYEEKLRKIPSLSSLLKLWVE